MSYTSSDNSYFDELGTINDTGNNWALSSRNLKKILRYVADRSYQYWYVFRKLDDYYKEVLLKGVDTSVIDVDAIGNLIFSWLIKSFAARSHDAEAIVNLLELVIGVAVLCENKANFIQRIFALDQSSQEVLKGMVERAMHRVWDLNAEEEQGDEGEHGDDPAYLSSQLRQFVSYPLFCLSIPGLMTWLHLKQLN